MTIPQRFVIRMLAKNSTLHNSPEKPDNVQLFVA